MTNEDDEIGGSMNDFTTENYRVYVNGALDCDIHPNINCARKRASQLATGETRAFIFHCIEYVEAIRGETKVIKPMEIWP